MKAGCEMSSLKSIAGFFSSVHFVWHIWDGLKDGFHALVNYHKLDRRNLEKLIFSYLGDWLTRQRQDVQNGVEGADTRLAAAEHLQGELKKILEGKEPYDIFVRWKPLEKQSIGWEPDLNDGVRMNIRPWITEAKLYRATKARNSAHDPEHQVHQRPRQGARPRSQRVPLVCEIDRPHQRYSLVARREAARARTPMKLLERLRESFAKTLRVPEGQAAPVAIVWTDATGEWLSLAPLLRILMPEFFTFGEYLPEERTGPAIWLKCIVDRTCRTLHRQARFRCSTCPT